MTRRLFSISLLTALPLFTAAPAFAQEQTLPTPVPVAPVAPGVPPTHPAPPSPPSAAGGAPASAIPGPTPADMQARRVTTTIDSGPENAVIERRVTTEDSYGRMLFAVPFHAKTETWEQVCVAPCKVDLDRYSSYRVAKANGVTSTRVFTLPPGAQALNLQVEPGNLLVHRIGGRLIALGTVAAIVGGALISTATKFDDEKEVRVAGVITGGAGLLLLGIGIPLAIVSQTHVKANDKKVAGGAPPAKGPKLTLGGFVF